MFYFLLLTVILCFEGQPNARGFNLILLGPGEGLTEIFLEICTFFSLPFFGMGVGSNLNAKNDGIGYFIFLIWFYCQG